MLLMDMTILHGNLARRTSSATAKALQKMCLRPANAGAAKTG
jgi:hypothetical protein